MMKCAEAGHAIAPLTHAYWGPEYSNDMIRETPIGARFELLDYPVTRCVTDLAEQKTVGWFQGRMEYGPRALGNRSILADPRQASMKDRINLTIKYREEFRPFCPSVLYERQADYFEDAFDAPFMVVTFPVSEKVVDAMPAVVHVDSTARIQSVQADSNPLYSRLIREFAKATSLPILINTSLNINEQPTTNAPLEALHTYFCSDVLTGYQSCHPRLHFTLYRMLLSRSSRAREYEQQRIREPTEARVRRLSDLFEPRFIYKACEKRGVVGVVHPATYQGRCGATNTTRPIRIKTHATLLTSAAGCRF